MNADNRLMFRISSAKKEAFLKKVNEEGKKASEVLVTLVEQYLGESATSSDLEMIKARVERHESEIEFLKQRLLGESAA